MKILLTYLLLIIGNSLFAQKVTLNELMSSNASALMDEDKDYSDWIEIYNPTEFAINLTGYGLSDNSSTLLKWTFPSQYILPGKYLIVFASGKDRKGTKLHTNFKISSTGESIFLSDSRGNIVDSVTFGPLPGDVSFGRKPDGTGTWFYFDKSTPGTANTTTGYTSITPDVEMPVKGGFYNSNVPVIISSKSAGASIYYTTDGSIPTTKSSLYTSPFLVTKTSTVRARALVKEALPGKVMSQTYFVNAQATSLPVIALSTDPKNLWDDSTGIYVMGKNASSAFPYFGANFWQDWERPVHLEYFEKDGTQKLNVDGGIKIYGNYSRAYAQKSVAIFARGEYGYSSFDYPFFDSKPFSSYSSFVLRNGGNDFNGTIMRDRIAQTTTVPLEIGNQANRFVTVYLNGEYWGVMTLREKLNEHFLAANYNVHPDSLDLLENGGDIINGSNTDYNAIITYLNKNSLSVKANYEYIKTKIDIESFKNYQIAEIFINNQDWPGNNIKFWRSWRANSKWRWLLYDTDYGYGFTLGTNSPLDYQYNTLNFATATNGPNWPNPPWSTLMLRKLLENDEFKNDFIVSYCHLMNTTFQPDSLLKIYTVIKNDLKNDIGYHVAKWKNAISDWNYNTSIIENFLRKRELYMRAFLSQKFGLKDAPVLTVDVNDGSFGEVIIQNYDVAGSHFTGRYFGGSKISLSAQPNPGYRFVRWEGSLQSDSSSVIVLPVSDDISVKAVFEKIPISLKENIVINEINYKSSSSFDSGDWVELYNNGADTVKLLKWTFKDSDDSHIFTFPDVSINPGEYIVLLNDTVKFKAIYPNVKNYIGTVVNGLSAKGDVARIYNTSGKLIDSVKYGIIDPWPSQPNGTGSTLSLINPGKDNLLAENWKASLSNGTPGKINDVYVTVVNNKEENIPSQFSLAQNYPNPFNPSTTINFSMPVAGKVKLSVIDVLGREVAVLVNGDQSAGTHQVILNADKYSLSSGIYFYTLSTNQFSATKKLLLVK